MSGRGLTVRELRDELARVENENAPVTIAVRTRQWTDPAMFVAYDVEALGPEWGNQTGQLLLQAARDVRIGVPEFGEPRARE